MRKCTLWVLIAALLCPLAASGTEAPKYLALVFDGCPSEGTIQQLLEGLESRNVRATFFLREEDCSRSTLLGESGQELGIVSHADPSLSRRDMAREIREIREKMPGNHRVRFLLHRGRDSVGFRQVAEALGLVILQPAAEGSPPADGDILLLDAGLPVVEALHRIDRLVEQGFTLVTVSELARLRGVSLHGGQYCTGFPRREAG